MKRVIDYLLAAILVYVGFVILMFFFQRSLMYHPLDAHLDPKRFDLPEMSVIELVTEDGLKLQSWYKQAKQQQPTILFLHGNAGHIGYRSRKVKPLLSTGYGLLLLSYRGYGSNPGKPTEEGLYLDAKAALKYLQDQGIKPNSIVLYGESLGTGVAVETAQGRNLAGMILEAPFTSMADTASRHYPFMPVRKLLKDRYNSAEKIVTFQSPLLIIHGENDNIVPFELGRRLFDAANEPKRFLPLKHAGHNDVYEYGVANQVISFLKKITKNQVTN